MVRSVLGLLLAVALAQGQAIVEIGTGLATTWLVGDNPARTPIISRDTAQRALGAGFAGVQPGAALQLLHPVSSDWRIGVGMEQTYFEGLQRFRLRVVDIYLRYTQTVTTLAAMVEYVLLRFPLARGSLALAVEPRWSIVSRGRYVYEQVDTRQGRVVERLDTLISKPPEPASRFGLVGRLGLGGELTESWYFRATVGFGVLNLLGRRPERGELLTPVKLEEQHESSAPIVVVALMLYYRIRIP